MIARELAAVYSRAQECLMDRWELTRMAAQSALCDVAEELGVDVEDLAALVAASAPAHAYAGVPDRVG